MNLLKQQHIMKPKLITVRLLTYAMLTMAYCVL
jgi:hypothetical protein